MRESIDIPVTTRGRALDLSKFDSCWDCTDEGEKVAAQVLLNEHSRVVAIVHACGHWHFLVGDGCAAT